MNENEDMLKIILAKMLFISITVIISLKRQVIWLAIHLLLTTVLMKNRNFSGYINCDYPVQALIIFTCI